MPMPRTALSRGSAAAIAAVSKQLAASSPVAARALPRSTGGETPLQLQNYRTDASTYFTKADGQSDLLFSAPSWVRIKLLLATAGPVAVGTSANISPPLSGHGILLDTNVPYETYLPKGARFYITSETVNRVSVTIEPVPWLEQLDGDTVSSNNAIRAAVDAMSAQVVAALGAVIAQLGGGAASATAAAQQASMPAMPPPTSLAMRGPFAGSLTPMAMPRKMLPRLRRRRLGL